MSPPGRSPPPHKRGAGTEARVTRTPPGTSSATAPPAESGGPASPAQAQEHRKRRRRLRRPGGLHCRGRGSRRAQTGKAERSCESRDGSRSTAAAASSWGSSRDNPSPAPPPRPPAPQRERQRLPWQEHSPPRLARPLCRRLSPQTTACPAPAPDAI